MKQGEISLIGYIMNGKSSHAAHLMFEKGIWREESPKCRLSFVRGFMEKQNNKKNLLMIKARAGSSQKGECVCVLKEEKGEEPNEAVYDS